MNTVYENMDPKDRPATIPQVGWQSSPQTKDVDIEKSYSATLPDASISTNDEEKTSIVRKIILGIILSLSLILMIFVVVSISSGLTK